jgi:hypothetical protein
MAAIQAKDDAKLAKDLPEGMKEEADESFKLGLDDLPEEV